MEDCDEALGIILTDSELQAHSVFGSVPCALGPDVIAAILKGCGC